MDAGQTPTLSAGAAAASRCGATRNGTRDHPTTHTASSVRERGQKGSKESIKHCYDLAYANLSVHALLLPFLSVGARNQDYCCPFGWVCNGWRGKTSGPGAHSSEW